MAKIKNKQELISKIKNAEGFSNEEKSQMLALINENKTYGLVWENSTEDAWEMMKDYVPVLKEDESRRIDHGSENPNHILIEGDNLNVLTALSYTHEGKIDVIYIDPPYNTGNNDFVYNDKFIGEDDSFRHSKWLSFMEKRLKIARRLLTEKGVIFISIDDNEQANLKILCDSIFEESNFIAKFDWRKKTGANDAKDIAVVTESILLYAKNHDFTIESNIWRRDEDSINQKRYKFEDEFVETRGKFYYDTLDRGGLQYSDSMNYGIEAPDGGIIYPNGRSTFVNDGWIWKWGQEKIKWGIENKFLEFVKSKKSEGSAYTIKYKVYQYVDNEGNIRKKAGRAYMNLIMEPINQIGNSEMKELFNNKTPFSNPKPIGLINYLLKTTKCEDSIILDFFAGSGTTLHATMQLNAEDGGHRQCILVTNNENNICEEVTYERNKRVIEGYTSPKGEKVEGMKDNNLRYFKVGFTPREKTDENMFRLAKNSLNLLRIKHDVYKEKQFGKLENPYKRYRYFEENGKQLLVILDTELIGDIVEQLEEMEVIKPIPTYVFSTGAYPFTEDFESVADKVELYPLPHSIYQACERNMPKMTDKEIENPEGISLSNEELETSMDDLTKEEA